MRVGVRVRVVRGWSGLEQLLGLRVDGDAAHALVEALLRAEREEVLAREVHVEHVASLP